MLAATQLFPTTANLLGGSAAKRRLLSLSPLRYILDRIDVPAAEYRDISSTHTEEASSAIRDRVQRAREKHHARFHFDTKVNCNARMGPRQIKNIGNSATNPRN